jgi:hypothetical protein
LISLNFQGKLGLEIRDLYQRLQPMRINLFHYLRIRYSVSSERSGYASL